MSPLIRRWANASSNSKSGLAAIFFLPRAILQEQSNDQQPEIPDR
jgi:hypothetical protein